MHSHRLRNNALLIYWKYFLWKPFIMIMVCNCRIGICICLFQNRGWLALHDNIFLNCGFFYISGSGCIPFLFCPPIHFLSLWLTLDSVTTLFLAPYMLQHLSQRAHISPSCTLSLCLRSYVNPLFSRAIHIRPSPPPVLHSERAFAENSFLLQSHKTQPDIPATSPKTSQGTKNTATTLNIQLSRSYLLYSTSHEYLITLYSFTLYLDSFCIPFD